jgi:hypothetical protein
VRGIDALRRVLPDVTDVRHEGDLAAGGLDVAGDVVHLVVEHLGRVDREPGCALVLVVQVVLRVRYDRDGKAPVGGVGILSPCRKGEQEERAEHGELKSVGNMVHVVVPRGCGAQKSYRAPTP